jgi:ribose-phosphate pyrophosphokinase
VSLYPIKIFTGSAHPELAQEICGILQMPLGKTTTVHLEDSEVYVTIDEAVRDMDIFFVQPCSMPVNDNLIELLLYLDAFRRASVHSISVVIPYFPYARQDRMARGREAISSRVVASLLETEGADRVIFVDIHNPAIQGFFKIPVDPVTAIPLLADYFKQPQYENAVIVSPDVGRASVAGKYAGLIGLPLAIMHKRRTGFSTTKTTHLVGDIAGRQPIIIDDIIAGGSVLKQLDFLYQEGAVGKSCFAITHPVLLPAAIETLESDERIDKLVVSNTIPVPPSKRSSKLVVLSIAPLLAGIIADIHAGRSISSKLVLS